MKEVALKIGSPTPLAAIASVPDNFDKDKPALIIFNSGVMHHVGTCRLSVKIARQAAETGFLALRFDFSGIGDSEARRGALSFQESSVKESKEIMDYLQEKKGISKFIVYGLCSGADASYEIAQIDERIIGMAQIDAYCYTNFKWMINRYVKRAMLPSMWPKIVRRLTEIAVTLFQQNKKQSSSSENMEMPSYIRVFPPKEEVSAAFRNIVRRDIAIYTIFTGDMIEVNYQNQFRDVFSEIDFKDLLREAYYPEVEHIVTSPYYQKKISDDLSAWIKEVSERNQR